MLSRLEIAKNYTILKARLHYKQEILENRERSMYKDFACENQQI